MPKAKADRARGHRPLPNLPTAEESAAAVQKAARRLGLLLDLHRVASRLRDLDSTKAARSSS
jgi:hypothetical protein